MGKNAVKKQEGRIRLMGILIALPIMIF